MRDFVILPSLILSSFLPSSLPSFLFLPSLLSYVFYHQSFEIIKVRDRTLGIFKGNGLTLYSEELERMEEPQKQS